jgi:hypothetical protein
VFATERILFCDASYILTQIINNNALQIQEHRYGSFITQIFPLLASKWHFPIGAVVMLYSVSFNLFYLSVVCVLVFVFKNMRLALLMAFYFTLITSDAYYWTNNEVHQAITWLFLLLGVMLSYKNKPYNFYLHSVIVVVLAFLSLFTHPLVVLIFPFLWLFVIAAKELNPYSRKRIYMFSIVFICIIIAKFILMKQGTYDTDKIHNATHFSLRDVLHAFVSPVARLIIVKMFTDYYFVPLLFLTGLYAAFKNKKYTHLLLTLIFFVGYFGAVCITFNDFQKFYMESELMPVILIATILFVYYALPSIKPTMAIAAVSLIFAVRLVYIFNASALFSQRKEWICNTVNNMKQQGIHKGYLYRNKELEDRLILTWGAPVESLLASALQGDKPTCTFVIDSPEKIKERMVQSKDIIDCFGTTSYQHFNSYYFTMDTVSNYTIIAK